MTENLPAESEEDSLNITALWGNGSPKDGKEGSPRKDPRGKKKGKGCGEMSKAERN